MPDSTLARKREDRLRKATAEREEANFQAAHAYAVVQNEAAQKAAVQVYNIHQGFINYEMWVYNE